MDQLQSTIEEAFERRAEITPRNVEARLKESVAQVLDLLDSGKLRVAEKIDGVWNTHQWIKKAVLLSFRIEDNSFIKGGFSNYFDKVRITAPRISATAASASCHPQRCVKDHLSRATWC